MALDPAGLDVDLEALASSPGATIAACATLWADATESYAAAIEPPSTGVSSAAAALETALVSAFGNSDAASTASAMEAAFAQFAATVGAGMAPAFTATPPPGEVGFAGLFAPPFPATHAEAAADVSSAIDAWMRTGTATPSGGGAPVNWS